jgi:ATP/maltotriose-dependent transcriptional regulator MalT
MPTTNGRTTGLIQRRRSCLTSWVSNGAASIARIVSRLHWHPHAYQLHSVLSLSCHAAPRGDADRTCSANRNEPPGLRTLAISVKTLSGSLTVQRTRGTTYALELRGNLIIDRGDTDAANADLEEALRLARQIGDRIRVGSVLSNLGDLALQTGDIATARRRLAEALDINREIGGVNRLVARWNLGVAEYLDGDSAAARELFTECINTARRYGDTEIAAYALLGCALALADAGEERAATVLHGAVDAAMGEVGIPFQSLEAGLRDADHARLRAILGDEAFDSAYQEGREMPYEEAVHLALRGGTP